MAGGSAKELFSICPLSVVAWRAKRGPTVRVTFLTAILAVATMLPAAAQETGRIKRKPPTAAEIAREAVDLAMNDSLLRKGDIIATDRGFVVFRGIAPDGFTHEFEPVASPMARSPR